YLPVNGLFGGYPGACTLFERAAGFDAIEGLERRKDFSHREALPEGERLPNNIGGVKLDAGEVFVFACAAGGGLGDPLERDPERVARDLRQRSISPEQARRVYGVVVRRGRVDRKATEARRAGI